MYEPSCYRGSVERDEMYKHQLPKEQQGESYNYQPSLANACAWVYDPASFDDNAGLTLRERSVLERSIIRHQGALDLLAKH